MLVVVATVAPFLPVLFVPTPHPSFHSVASTSAGAAGAAAELPHGLLGDSYDGVAWVVQVSDVHLSVNHPDRFTRFSQFVGETLPELRPEVVLLTGE